MSSALNQSAFSHYKSRPLKVKESPKSKATKKPKNNLTKADLINDILMKKRKSLDVSGKSNGTSFKKPKHEKLKEKVHADLSETGNIFLNELKQSQHHSTPRSNKSKLERSKLGGRQIAHKSSNKNGLSVEVKKNKPGSSFADSITQSKQTLAWMIDGMPLDTFVAEFWEHKPCHIERSNPAYYAELISNSAIDQMLRENYIEYTKNIDIALYENGKRTTLNPDGRALPGFVWDSYSSGSSIRLLNPQTYMSSCHSLCADLQEYFHAMVGINAYLTPPQSQGFAPHYDDIEAFVLQIEGQKRWRLYAPRSLNETLPRESSRNFSQSEIGQPIMDVILKAGDMLYFPRGTIHQACTVMGHHSLHLTVSTYQKQSWADLLEMLVPAALSAAIQSDVNLRRGLPLNLFDNFGIARAGNATKENRKAIANQIRELMQKTIENAPIDDVIDSFTQRFNRDVVPPFLKPDDLSRTIFGLHTRLNKHGKIASEPEIINETTKVRLLRAHICRIVKDGESHVVYYYGDNSREYHEREQFHFDLASSSVAALKKLIKSYPTYVPVIDLPAENIEASIEFTSGLWDLGLLMTEHEIK